MGYGVIKIPVRLYESRLQRLKRLIELEAPTVIIHREMLLTIRSFERRTFRQWLQDMRFRYAPHWLMYLTSSDYRMFSKQTEEEKDE